MTCFSGLVFLNSVFCFYRLAHSRPLLAKDVSWRERFSSLKWINPPPPQLKNGFKNANVKEQTVPDIPQPSLASRQTLIVPLGQQYTLHAHKCCSKWSHVRSSVTVRFLWSGERSYQRSSSVVSHRSEGGRGEAESVWISSAVPVTRMNAYGGFPPLRRLRVGRHQWESSI